MRPLFIRLFVLLGLFFPALSSASAIVAWADNFGPSGSYASISGTAADTANHVYITGTFGKTLALGNATLTAKGLQDAFVAKLDSSGNVLWAKSFGGSQAQVQANGIAVDASGNVYVGGDFSGSNLTAPQLAQIGSYDAFAIKLDSSGNVLWAKNFGGSGTEADAFGIAVDGSGNVYLGGVIYGNLTTPALTIIGTQDAFAFKLDSSSGNVLWAKNFGGSGAAADAFGIAVDASFNVYLGGYFGGGNLTTPTLTMIGNQDAYALKLDSSGNVTWAKNYGGSGVTAYGNGIALDASGDVYLGGDFGGGNLTTPALTQIGAEDAYALKLDSSGSVTWAHNFGGDGAKTLGNSIAVDASGNVYLGGAFSGNLTTPALTGIGANDAYAFKLDSSGYVFWAQNYGGSGATANGYGIALDASGNVYLAGGFTGGNLTTPALTLIGGGDAFLLNLNTSTAMLRQELNFVAGWNLVGNGVNAPLTVATAFGNTTNVSSVWKWEASASKWAFYTPSLSSTALSTYAALKGYDVLTTISGGEGFWVNANTGFTTSFPAGTAILSSAFQDSPTGGANPLPSGWSLIAVGDNPTPKDFVNAIAAAPPGAPPAVGAAATSLNSLWAFDSASSDWYFYDPARDNADTLASYISSKGYEDFTAKGKTLDPTTGFWVSHP